MNATISTPIGLTQENKVLRNTYGLLGLSMIPTIIGAWAAMQLPLSFYTGNMIVFFIVSLVGMIGLSMAVHATAKTSMGVAMMLLFAGFVGATLAPTLLITLQLKNGAQLIGTAAGITMLALFAVVAYIQTTKKDFSFLGGILYTSIWVLLAAMVVSMFFPMPAMQLVISCVAVIIFVGYLLYDVSAVVHGGEKNYIIATVQIYMDLINLFVHILRILSILTGDKD